MRTILYSESSVSYKNRKKLKCSEQPRNGRNRDPASVTPGAKLSEKNTGFRAQKCFHPWIHTLVELVLFSPPAWNFSWHIMTWWQDCPWTFVRNLEDFELNFLWLYISISISISNYLYIYISLSIYMQQYGETRPVDSELDLIKQSGWSYHH